ncbi:sulfotransferase [Oscillatoriales cyanobacterium LEGE 11467]|uniref:Sulfotransferase n=1 Tax=Zarconia navalis LEGE 11467 TaxID=1828826 RepID=A0A928VXA3_9CYAN|nr:sulfotransferase [Zarconia navalis]MBE9039853.1 sulfotransferase [Zarconia navalis LEGE 11467]
MITILRFKRKIFNLLNPIRLTKNLIWRYNSQISQKSHVFVVGSPRSGTTLMFAILAAHPSFIGIETETFFFVPRDIFNIKSYHRISEVSQLNSSKISELMSKSKNLVNFYDNLSDSIKPSNSEKRFLEKTPFHIFYLSYLSQKFPNAKFINMIRDGRDCYVSNNKLPKQFHMPPQKFAMLWKDSVRARIRLGEQPNILDVRYEQLTKDPFHTTRKIMNFLGEEFMENQINSDYYSQTKMFQGMNGHERLQKEIKPTSIGQWRKKMTAKEISEFERTARNELKELMYE